MKKERKLTFMICLAAAWLLAQPVASLQAQQADTARSEAMLSADSVASEAVRLSVQRRWSSLPRHEVTARLLALGPAALPFDSDHGHWTTLSSSWGYGLGVGYTYWMGRTVGVSSGLTLRYVSSSQRLEDFSGEVRGTIPATDGHASSRFTATLGVETMGQRESQTVVMAELPVELSLRWRHLTGSLGAVLATSLTSYAQYSSNAISYRITSIDDASISVGQQPVEALVTRAGASDYAPSEERWPFFVMATAEVGYRFDLRRMNALTLSLYGRLSLNSCDVSGVSEQSMRLANGVATTTSPVRAGLVDRYRYYAAGLAVTYHVGLGRPMAGRRVAGRSAEVERIYLEDPDDEEEESEALERQEEAETSDSPESQEEQEPDEE